MLHFVIVQSAALLLQQIKSKRYKMNAEETTCCICKIGFTEASQPRMMPYCQHSACTSCLKKLISKAKELTIVCQHCGHQESLTEVDLQYFPKNICLTKMLKEKSNSIANSFSQQSQSSRDSISSANPAQQDREICQEHKKDLQLICINDRVKLCAHCALFGPHKDHKFKTINEVGQFIEFTYAQFAGFKEQKVLIDNKINSNEFKQGIVKKIGQEKDRLVCEIKKKFGQMIQNVKLAQKKAYEDVVKNFKTVYTKILALIKEENESQERFKKWQIKCTQLFVKAQKMKRIEDKVALYYGPLEICNEGSSILKRLQAKINSNIQVIETLVSQIKVVENSGIVNSVFNYINVVLQENQIDILGNIQQQGISPSYKEEIKKEQKIEFGGDHLHTQRDSISPIRKKSKSKDIASKISNSQKRSSKLVASSQRGTVNQLVEQFCERQNLDTLDLTNYSLNDQQIYEVLAYLKPIKRIKGLKLVKNKLTNEGLSRIIELMPFVTNINLSFNQLGDECVVTLLNNRPKISSLRIINLSNNKINERKTKNSIEQLKKQGVIVTL